MIIDVHGHTTTPKDVWVYQAKLLANRGNPDPGPVPISDEQLVQALENHLGNLDSVGTDLQFISPRPYAMMHSVEPECMVITWTKYVNDIIARQCKLFPDRFKGVAGLPQFPGVGLSHCIEELERTVKELGFVGCLLNPDPAEGKAPTPPGLGDEYWYPLYEKLVELDVPALVHSAGCCSPRESYTLHFINEESIAILSLLESKVFEDFPKLKIVISHGGGAIPYQMGRFRSWRVRQGRESFDESMKKLHFETCNYSQDSLELLLKVVGSDNVLFGTENPGTGSEIDPTTGRYFDDVKPYIDAIEWLTDEDRSKIFEQNARKLYRI